MTKNMRKIVALFCLLTVMLTPYQAVLASEENMEYSVVPLMTYIGDYTIDFGITG